jgi:cytochrome c-type biogenesis protein CcmH
MTITFLVLASIMVIVAIAFMLTPLLRAIFKTLRQLDEAHRELKALDDARATDSVDPTQYAVRRAALGEALLGLAESRQKRVAPMIYAALAITAGVPVAALCLYLWWGSPHPDSPATVVEAAELEQAKAGPPIDHGTDMQEAIAKLAEKLRQHPDDAEGWVLLGRTYKATEHYAEAREAFRHALEASPQDPDVAREYANAETPDVTGSAMDAAPAHSAETSGAGETGPMAPSDATTAPNSVNRSAHVLVKVALDPRFKDSVQPSDTLFVFAKAAHGPPMPLAITRITAGQLPANLTLTDAMGMVPGLTLSRFPQIIVGARISKSGIATPKRGDLQSLPASTTTAQTEPVQLIIAERVD